MSDEHIRVVVGVDFGTTFSGFSYAHVHNPKEIFTNHTWPTGLSGSESGRFKANTLLHYDVDSDEVIRWGRGAVAKPRSKKQSVDVRIAELFKLHLAEADVKGDLPPGITARMAAKDYLTEMNKVVKSTLEKQWPMLAYPQDVRFVFTVPAEYSHKQRDLMRRIICEAGFLESRYATNLEFTTEPEAAAIHCLDKCSQYSLDVDDSYIIVDCGGGTVDLTVRKILKDEQISEVTQQTGGFCGSVYVDQEFVQFLVEKLGRSAIDKLKTDHYQEYHHLIDTFCTGVKHSFTGEAATYEVEELDLSKIAPSIIKLVTDNEKREELEENDWIVEIEFEDLKSIFEPAIARIIRLISDQLHSASSAAVRAIFLVGGFSESEYLRARVKRTFEKEVPTIVHPPQPQIAIVQGATKYGLDMGAVKSRKLKYTYGVRCARHWRSRDPSHRRRSDGTINLFSLLATIDKEVEVDERFSGTYYPLYADQTAVSFRVLTTKLKHAKYPDEPPMQPLGTLNIDIPDVQWGKDRPILFSLSFGRYEIEACAKNQRTDEEYSTTFNLDI